MDHELDSEMVKIRQFTQSEVESSIQSLPGISEVERSALLRETSQLFKPKSSNLLEGGDHIGLSEKDILNQLRMNNPSVSEAVLQELDSNLDTSQDSFGKLKDINVMIIETSLQDQNYPAAHVRIVSSIVQQENPNLKEHNIAYLGLREGGGSTEGLLKAADLSLRIQADGGEPPVVNMSLEVGGMIDLTPDESGMAGGSDIFPQSLGYSDDVTPEDISRDPEDLRRRLTELADRGDYSAKRTLSEADALLTLANTGAKVNVAWGNKDKVNLVGILTQGHPNITFIAAVDGHNNLSENLNWTTGHLAEQRYIGNVLILPEKFKGQVNPDSVDGARVIYTPIESSLPLAGQNPEKLTLTDDQVEPIGEQVRQINAISDSFYLKRTVLSAIDSMGGSGEIDYAMCDMLLNKRESIDDAILKAGLPPLGTDNDKFIENLTAILKDPVSSAKLLNQLDLDIKGNTPAGMAEVSEDTIKTFTDQVTAPLKDRLVTPEQYTKIFGTPPPKGIVPSDSKGDAPVYLLLKDPRVGVEGSPSGYGIETYQAVQLTNGQYVLAVPTEGTSFSTPIQTGIDSKK